LLERLAFGSAPALARKWSAEARGLRGLAGGRRSISADPEAAATRGPRTPHPDVRGRG